MDVQSTNLDDTLPYDIVEDPTTPSEISETPSKIQYCGKSRKCSKSPRHIGKCNGLREHSFFKKSPLQLRNQLTNDLNTKKRKHEDEVLKLQEDKQSIAMEIQELETDKENIDLEVRFVQS